MASAVCVAQAPPVQFNAPLLYGAGGKGASSVAIGDLNGDGKPDLAVANQGGVGVLLGNGDGSFQQAIEYDSGGYTPTSVAIVDVNGDGHADVLAVNEGSVTSNGHSILGVLLGNGDGTFRAAVGYSCGFHSISVATADLNGDGKPDVVVANLSQSLDLSTAGGISVLLGNGDGTLQTAVEYGAGGFSTSSVAIGDVNGDGKPDLAVANQCSTTSGCFGPDGSVVVLLGNGDGTFQPALVNVTGNQPDSIAIGDLNGDHKPDLVAASGLTVVLLGNGDGTFQAPVGYVIDNGGTVAIGDVNGDNIPDVAVTHSCGKPCGGNIRVLLGNGDGSLQSPVDFGVGGLRGGIAGLPLIADVNADGRPDLIVADLCNTCVNGSVGVLLNRTVYGTTTVLAPSANPSVLGQPVTFTASVTSAELAVPDGTRVTFYDGTTEVGTSTTAHGTASFTIANLSAKKHTVRATFAGTAWLRTSTSTATEIVNRESTSTSYTSSLNPAVYGQTITFTATVAGAGPTPPTGNVSFVSSGNSLASVKLNGSGVAVLTTRKLNAGTYPLTAVYEGDADNQGSTSTAVNQVVNQAMSAAMLTSSPNPSTVGQAVTFTAKITSPTVIATGPVVFSLGQTTLGTA